MVDRGLGVALVPDWAPPWPAGLALRRLALPPPVPVRRIGLFWMRSSPRLALVEAFPQHDGGLAGARQVSYTYRRHRTGFRLRALKDLSFVRATFLASPSVHRHEGAWKTMNGKNGSRDRSGRGSLRSAISLTLAKAGAGIAVLDVNPDGARALAEKIRALGGNAVPIVGDLTTRRAPAACPPRPCGPSAISTASSTMPASIPAGHLRDHRRGMERQPRRERARAYHMTVAAGRAHAAEARGAGSSTSPRSTPSRPIPRTATMPRPRPPPSSA